MWVSCKQESAHIWHPDANLMYRHMCTLPDPLAAAWKFCTEWPMHITHQHTHTHTTRWNPCVLPLTTSRDRAGGERDIIGSGANRHQPTVECTRVRSWRLKCTRDERAIAECRRLPATRQENEKMGCRFGSGQVADACTHPHTRRILVQQCTVRAPRKITFRLLKLTDYL